MWELIVRNPSGPPSNATSVLIQAINRRTLDWPEKIMEICLRHCNNYEEVDTLLKVMGTVHRLSRVVAARRVKETADAAAMYAQQQSQAPVEIPAQGESPSASKRKRESASEDPDAGAKKKTKGADQSSSRDQHLKPYLRELFKDCGEIFSVRWPSLKFNTHRRFCYVTFRTPSAAAAATALDGKTLGDFYKLVAKYSDPAAKKNREGAVAEGREIHITSLDSSITEDELKLVFSKYGEVERVNILKKYTGVSKGAAFVAFGKKEEAAAALEMNMTKLKSTILRVEMSLGKNFKPTSTILGKGSSASPTPDGASAMTDRIQVGRGKKPAEGLMQPTAPVRRPGTAGRGGLGQKKGGLGFAAPKTSGANSTHVNGHAPSESDGKIRPKSNADFKAMYVGGGNK
ncbi:hypothetical protein BUE80_DR013931 [Diplocarpon rosae]|nr:hypothetical protein BUE80_DR013931 [Diplocarpon rosae]